jgi:hypothetical protein
LGRSQFEASLGKNLAGPHLNKKAGHDLTYDGNLNRRTEVQAREKCDRLSGK